ncbi:hypothetical protein O181_041626 [Austropuccinia psidii MF-1]|uniref:Integrase catalytic domain-containing protein n=1 Tax=Austropuccinia psidii MF-1 TaxID=1389203 RepID=A0A9Q3HEE6_9BASI|nr:hypothetical protein [Austropuccinia psidii MF-1]
MVILNRIINLNESTVSLDEGFTEMQNLLRALKSSLGSMWTDDSLLEMSFHQFNKAQFHQIANSLDTKKSIDPSCVITAQEGIEQPNNMSCQHYPPKVSQQTDASNKFQPDNRPSRYPHPSMQSAEWATKWLSPEHPCIHWAMYCPRKLAGKPPIEDPKKRDATFRYHKSNFVSHPTLVSVEAKNEGEAELMSIKATTEDSKLVLIDSEDTHHVAGYSYEHHQNGKVERTNRTLAEAARSMMIRANLPPTFWTYALQHAAWEFNRVLHANDNITTHEEVIQKKPSLSLLHVFGCMAFLHNMTQKKDLTTKATEVIHLGVAQDSQG